MVGFLVPSIFAISIWYMIEAGLLLKRLNRSQDDQRLQSDLFTHAGRWYLVRLILGLEKISPSLLAETQDRLLRLRISAGLGVFCFALFLHLVKS